MDFLSRLIGGSSGRPGQRHSANDPDTRLAKFKRLYHTVLGLCNRPRDLSNEGPLLTQLHDCLERIVSLLREETRASAPHLCLQFSAVNRIYTIISRAASASQDERVIGATVSMLVALIDSEEEDFLSNAIFAKSLMRLVTSIVDSGAVLINIETESAILELLFTITAKIRLQPDILPFWFNDAAKQDYGDVFTEEKKKNFVGVTQKNDFPLCYILADRVHYDGRIGDFARTGLLYIFEATGRSFALEEWIVSSDLPTLLASGLGALYSQLSRELSILHPDATLPAVLAMSDYTTTHARATAVSAFSDKHKGHMATFLSYLAFWQDLLDHSKSADVKHTLLDHFQILFLQQLLYPSLLQSSDTDGGSSVAVLTYLCAVLESLEYKDLTSMILDYLFAIQAEVESTPDKAATEVEPPRSPTTIRKRESLMLLAAPKDPNDAVEPALFNLADLILSNMGSQNAQAVFAALKLASTILSRQKTFAFGSLVKTHQADSNVKRTTGALEIETNKYNELATVLHDHAGIEEAYAGLAEDVRTLIEAQVTCTIPAVHITERDAAEGTVRFGLSPDDPFLKASRALLRTFFTNSIDVNLALTQAIISLSLCTEVCLDGWFASDPIRYAFAAAFPGLARPWASHLDAEEITTLQALQQCSQRPIWSLEAEPKLYSTLHALIQELERVRNSVPHMDHLIAVRKTMLQATTLETPLVSSEPSLIANSPSGLSFFDTPEAPKASRNQAANTAASPPHVESSSFSLVTGRNHTASPATTPLHTGSLSHPSQSDAKDESDASWTATLVSIFMPPPVEAPSTTDVLMQTITFPPNDEGGGLAGNGDRQATLNHVLTNVVILQEFILELVAVLQVRAAVLGEKEVRFV